MYESVLLPGWPIPLPAYADATKAFLAERTFEKQINSVQWTHTAGGQYIELPVSVTFTITNNSGAGGMNPFLRLTDQDGMDVWDVICSAAIPAAGAGTNSFLYGIAQPFGSAGLANVAPFPVSALWPGWKLTSGAFASVAGVDVGTAPVMQAIFVPTSGYHDTAPMLTPTPLFA